ncbi:threonylcarbamoyl-AMP synthase [Dactylosporangium roseum]|uniref:L-threonylcarbamoyladenylate synthase n=1 Tax=Dactylosporangium roseum TaxID=47989 RepID=A0ABY5ZEX3_9ACTN|nr:L-threonylcarbamoyladenylate synthase [Dactylosporangium roseum]UWZ40234.1 threonylcarbamoyl-AMP synthase [Dactylosporangium roseum]
MLYDCSQLAERERGIAAAIEAVQRGDLIVMPTDTIYGIGADAFKSWSVTALNNAKGRTAPVPVLVGSRHTLDGLVFGLPQAARDLVDAFWPGALTIVVEHAPSLQWDLGSDDGTVAVRMPLHPIALEVLRETGPMAVSSANKVGQPLPQTAEEARDQLGYAVSVYLSTPAELDNVTSTIVDVTANRMRAVRLGGIDLDQLREVVPEIEDPAAA